MYLGEGFKDPGYIKISSTTTYGEVLSLYINSYNPLTSKPINLDNFVSSNEIINIEPLKSISQQNNVNDDIPFKNYDINRTNISELTAVPGIGEKTAQLIIEYIDLNKPISDLNDLLNIKGIGEKTLENIRKYYK